MFVIMNGLVQNITSQINTVTEGGWPIPTILGISDWSSVNFDYNDGFINLGGSISKDKDFWTML